MDATTSPTPVGFYLHTPAMKQSVMQSPNPNTEYIIVQNDTLTEKNKALTKERDDLLKENNEMEREMDKLEASTQYLRRLMTNIVELKKMAFKLKESQSGLYGDTMKHLKISDKYLTMMFSMAKRYLIINVIVLCIMMAAGQTSMSGMLEHILIEFIAITILITNHYDTFSVTSIQNHFVSKTSFMNENTQKMDYIKKLEKEIKTVEESHDYLNELIAVA